MQHHDSDSGGKLTLNRRFVRDLVLFSLGGLLVAALVALLAWRPKAVTADLDQEGATAPSELTAPEAPAEYVSSENLRKYYLTATTWSGSQVMNENVCLEGFHVASAWELLDTSNLQYYRHGNSFILADSGHGPPVYYDGWVQTGYSGDTSTIPGRANCNNWTLEGNGEHGTTLWLPTNWSGGFELHYWNAQVSLCSEEHFVWCMEDGLDVTPPMRQFYLTQDSSYDGGEPDGSDGYGAGVCSIGYHFASMFEVIDPSNLQYNPNLGQKSSDSGMGPPTGFQGWIRNGYWSSYDISTGKPNCYGWDSAGSGEYGTVVSLPSDWSDPSQQDIHVWTSGNQECSTSQRVWCVANEVNSAGSCAQPETIHCGELIHDSTYGMPSHLSTYECAAGWVESGPEKVYALSLPEGWTYDVTAEITLNEPIDLDVFFLTKDGCATGATMNANACGDSAVTQTDLPPGTYYIVVDGYNGDWGNFDLQVSCSPTFIYIPKVEQ